MSDIEGWVDEVHTGHVIDKLEEMPSDSVHSVVTSPPYYGLRQYSDSADEIGKEDSLDEYIGKMVAVGNELQRVLRDDGSWWLNLGDTYSGGGGAAGKPDDWDDMHNDDNFPDEPPAKNTSFPDKDKMLVPHRTAIALQESGWIVRNDVVWDKQGSSMPESVTDRLSTTFEYVFHFVQQCDCSIGEPESGIVLDPFIGSGTTAVVAQDLGRKWIGIDLQDEYVDMAENRAKRNPGQRQHNDAMDW